MDITKHKWKLPSAEDGNAFMIRSEKAEQHLRQALDILYAIKETSETKEIKKEIENFIYKFQ